MEVINTIGRRKCSVARIYMTPGDGKIIVNFYDFKDDCGIEKITFVKK